MNTQARWILALVAFICLGGMGLWVHEDGIATGRDLERAANARQSDRARAANDLAALENNQRSEKASHDQAQQHQQLQALDAHARNELERLREQLAILQRAHPTASTEALRSDATTLAAVFGDCAREYQQLAEKADGHALDAATFDAAWPTTAAARE